MGTEASELNLGALLPDIGTVVGLIKLALLLAVMAGPLLLLIFGRMYLKNPPKEANYGLGYRFWWGMASLESWTYTQKLAGKVWSLLGCVLTAVMAVVCIILLFMEPMAMALGAALCLLGELVAVAAACIAINVKVMKKFDKDGYLRDETAE